MFYSKPQGKITQQHSSRNIILHMFMHELISHYGVTLHIKGVAVIATDVPMSIVLC